MSQVHNKGVNALANLMAGTSISKTSKKHVAPKYVPRFSRRVRGSTKFKLGKRTFKFVPNYIKTRRNTEKPILHTITATRKKGQSVKNLVGKYELRRNINGNRNPFLL